MSKESEQFYKKYLEKRLSENDNLPRGFGRESMIEFADQYLKERVEAISDEDINKFSKEKFMLGDDKLPHTIGESFCLKIGAKWLKSKLLSKE